MISGGNCQEVGVLYNIGSRMQQGQPQTSMLRLQHLGNDCVSAAAIAAGIPIVIDDWPFFLSCSPKFLHTGIIPEMIVDIVLAPNSVLGGTGANTYSLSNIYFTIEVVQFDNDLYSKILETRLANGDTIEIPFLDAHYIIKPSSNIIETQVSANAITKMFVVPRVNGTWKPEGGVDTTSVWSTQGAPVNGLTKPFVFDIGANAFTSSKNTDTNTALFISNAKTAYWSIDNKMYPTQPASVPELYQMTIDAFGDRASTSSANSLLLEPVFGTLALTKADGTAPAAIFTAGSSGGTVNQEIILPTNVMAYKYIAPVDNYLGRNCIFALNLEVNEGADQRLISGYSSVGKNAVIRFDASQLIKGLVDLTMFVLVKRCLKVRAGQQIYLEM
jgi:hypothetical protein